MTKLPSKANGHHVKDHGILPEKKEMQRVIVKDELHEKFWAGFLVGVATMLIIIWLIIF